MNGGAQVLGLMATLSFAGLAIAAWRSKRFRSLTFTVWIGAFISAALSFPEDVTHFGDFQFHRLFTPLIWIIMFGMGAALTFDDFARIAKMPWGVLVGIICQYTIMPVMGWTFACLFGLEPEVALGLILVGSCPGGASSNVLNYIAGANVALSVTMTAFSTLISPVTTPLAMKLLAGQIVAIPFGPMAIEIVKMVVVPVVAGLLINRFFPRLATKLGRFLPMVSMLCICLIIAVTIGMSRDKLLSVGFALFGASVCHNAAGYLLGYYGARLMKLNRRDSRTVAIEVGIQNCGMATGLAINVLNSKIAALASAVFGPWSAAAGSLLASYWHARPVTPMQEEQIVSGQV